MIRKILITLFSIVLLFILTIVMFLNFSSQFGKAPSKEDTAEFEKLPYYSDGKFQNLIPTNMDMDFWESVKLLPEFFKNDPTRKPDFQFPYDRVDSLQLTKNSLSRLIWFGHSAFLLQMDGKNILLDPMFGDVPAPHPWLGKKRYAASLPIEVEKLPEIDLVLFSHDHYDHLDYESVQKMKDKTKEFYVPLGVGSHLKSWGVAPEKIHEMNWWQEAETQDLFLAFTPTRHFSGRGLGDRFSTLWGSWVIQGNKEKIYFSGDSGYGSHFKEIGEKYGPFDFAMMECGQYNEKWKDIHMMPEETAQAAVDIQARAMMPIHWAAFTLALHTWTDPVERVLVKAEELNMSIIVPKIGSEIQISKEMQLGEKWWIKP